MQATILVVAEPVHLRNLLTVTLQKEGFQVVTASFAEEALAQLQKACPDLILIDFRLPEMDGFQLLDRLREQAETRLIPVILLGAKSSEGTPWFDWNLFRLEQAGCPYLLKPFAPKALFDLIGTLLKTGGTEEHEGPGP